MVSCDSPQLVTAFFTVVRISMSPQKVTPQLILALSRCVPFAPLHLPGQLEVIRTITSHYPDLPQVACFDTAFHRRIPEVAQRFSLPRFLWDEGIRRYGFHGLSFEFIVASIGTEAGSRMIIAHLGNGASMAAVLNGVPADTTMGLTPTGGMMMGTRSGDLDPGVLLFNTLLDNDRVSADLKTHLDREFGRDCGDLYWMILDELRNELGYTDYLGALQRYRLVVAYDPRVLEVSSFLVEYPFANRLYAGSLETVRHLRQWGPTVILSDGDVVFQPRKVQRSGLWDAVEGRVLIYIHKEQMLDDVKRRYPAHHYIMVDDKLRILAAMKRSWQDQ